MVVPNAVPEELYAVKGADVKYPNTYILLEESVLQKSPTDEPENLATQLPAPDEEY